MPLKQIWRHSKTTFSSFEFDRKRHLMLNQTHSSIITTQYVNTSLTARSVSVNVTADGRWNLLHLFDHQLTDYIHLFAPPSSHKTQLSHSNEHWNVTSQLWWIIRNNPFVDWQGMIFYLYFILVFNKPADALNLNNCRPADMCQICSHFHKSMILGTLVQFGPWTFSENKNAKMPHGGHFTYCQNRIILCPEPNVIIQNRCLPVCFDGRGLQWYHTQHHKLFRWIVHGEFSDLWEGNHSLWEPRLDVIISRD